MGRAKVTLELIAKEKARILTFNQRKKGLLKKIHDFATLCDVAACLIIYGPKQDSGSSSEPEIWPEDPNKVRRVLDVFRAKKKDDHPNYGISEFLEDRKKKIECDLAKQRRKNLEAKYPTRPEFIDFMTESQLRGLAASLEIKADFVRSRIDFLRGSNMAAGYAHQPQWPSHDDYPLLGNGNYCNNNNHDSSFSQFWSSDLGNDDQLDLSFLDLSWDDELSRYCEGWDETKPAEQQYYSCGAPMGLQQVHFFNMEGIGG